MRRILLACGIVASLLYVAVDVVAAIRYPDYHSFTARAISELMARGAPTERLVDPLLLAYGVLMIGFGVGVWLSGSARRVHVTAGLLIAYAAIGLLGPTLFEMDVRTGGPPTAADVRHIGLTAVLVVFIFAAVGTGASIRGRGFRDYSYATLAIMLVSGILTGVAMRGPGPLARWVGVAERIDIGAFMLWVIVLAISLARERTITDAALPRDPGLPRTAALPAR